jgi:hypothetical protein
LVQGLKQKMSKKVDPKISAAIIFILLASFSAAFYFLSRQEAVITAKKAISKKISNLSAGKKKDLRLLFASNGQKNIYKIQRDDKWVVEIDGQEGAAYDFVDNPAFSPDGTQFAYSAMLNSQSFVVVGHEVQQQVYDRILQILFSSDGQTLGYVAQKGDYNVVVLNGQEGDLYQQISQLQTSSGTTYIVFSPDGQSVAYKVVDDNGTYMVINGETGQVYSDIISFVFSPDGTFTYQAVSGDQSVTVTNQENSTGSTASTANTTTTTSGTTSQSSSTSSSSTTKNWKKSTTDVHLDEGRLYYPNCSGDDCNF